MKKKVLIVLVLLLLFAGTVYAALNVEIDRGITITAVVLEVSENDGVYGLTFCETENTVDPLANASLDQDTKITGAKNEKKQAGDIKPSQLIEITHDGTILEIYPKIYSKIYKIKILGEADKQLYESAGELLKPHRLEQ